MERIDKILSHEGFGSRKDIKKLLRKAEVLVNGNRILDAGFLLDPTTDIVSIDGEEISLRQEIYIMMNKIKGTISANKDGEHQTVFEFLDEEYKTTYLQDKLHLIGRLDMDTEGLLLFTTDGGLTHRLISPKSHISKTYFVSLEKKFSEEEKREVEHRFKDGIHIPPEDNESACDCLPAEIHWCTREENAKYCVNSTYSAENVKESALLTIYEGKYHQVKRMFLAVNNKVEYLKRISMGSLELDYSLPAGGYKELSENELDKLS